MFRILSITITLAAIISMSGCVLGPGCGGGQCDSCDGYGNGGCVGMGGPGDSFRQWRRSLTCGSGCGETYYDEWYSSPPDCEDPCPQFACGGGGCGGGCGVGCLDGGCGGCGGGCCGGGIQPIRRIAGLAVGLYGKRFCGECGYDYGDCCCEGGFDGGCSGGGCDGGEISGGGTVIQGGGGCAGGNCSINRSPNRTVTARVANSRVRRSPAHQQAMARQQMTRSQANGSSEGQVIHPDEPAPKFYRQAKRLPQRQPAFRR